MMNYGGKNLNQFIYLNETMSCVDLYISQNSTKPGSSLWKGLVGYWPFDIDSRDLSGNGNDGNVSGAVFNESGGQMGGGYEFDGFNDYIDIGNNESLNLTEDLTVSIWIYPKDLTTSIRRDIVTKGTAGSYEWALVSSSNNQTTFIIWNTAAGNFYTATGSSKIIENNWYHVLGKVNSSGAYIYLNGSEDGSDLISSGTREKDGVAKIYVGARETQGSDDFFNGTLDELRIYNRSLNSSEISELYDRQKNKYYDQKLITNWTAISWNKEYLNNTKYWMWADYECNYSYWDLFSPDIWFRTCASDVDVCSEEFI